MKPSECSAGQRDQLIEKYCYVNVDYEWWDCTYGDFKEGMLERGFAVQDINFSGFSCQGDGASFTGYVCNYVKFFEHYFKDQYPMILKFLVDWSSGTSLRMIRSDSRYCHENTVCCDFDIGTFQASLYDSGDYEFQQTVYAIWNVELDKEVVQMETAFVEAMRNEMRALYTSLNEEYKYLTSDECIWEWIENNLEDVSDDVELID